MLVPSNDRAISSQIAEQIAAMVGVGSAHHEATGGSHFSITLHSFPPVVEKRAHNEGVLKSVRIAQDRLDGVVVPFVVGTDERIFQQSVPSLLTVIKGSPAEAETLMRRYFDCQLNCIKQGVVNWDPKLENYGVDESGNVKLIDLGGLVLLQDCLQEIDAISGFDYEPDDSEISYMHLKMGDGLPRFLKETFSTLRGEYGLANGASIYSTLLRLSPDDQQVAPRPVVWRPSFLD